MSTSSTTSAPIVIGYDGSPDSDLALAAADDWAGVEKRPLRVIIAAIDSTAPVAFTSQLRGEHLVQVEATAHARTQSSAASEVTVEVLKVEPTRALIEASDGARLVVLGAQGHNVAFGYFLGSVSHHVTQHAKCPTLVVRPPRDSGSRRIVVGFDGSPPSIQALEFALEHAARFGGNVSIVQVLQQAIVAAGPALFGYPPDYFADFLRDAAKHLSDQLSSYRVRHPDVEASVDVVFGVPSRVLADASKAASLLVVGSRGRGAFAGMLLGSVSAGVLHHARCSVLILH